MDVRIPLLSDDHADLLYIVVIVVLILRCVFFATGLGLGSGQLGSHLLLREDEVAPWLRRHREGGQRA
jgi:hypothetical protein